MGVEYFEKLTCDTCGRSQTVPRGIWPDGWEPTAGPPLPYVRYHNGRPDHSQGRDVFCTFACRDRYEAVCVQAEKAAAEARERIMAKLQESTDVA